MRSSSARFLLGLVALLLLVQLPAPVHGAALVQLAVRSTPVSPLPDTDATLDLTLRNVGDRDLFNLRADVRALSPELQFSDVRYELGTLSIGANTTAQVPFHVPAGLPPGHYGFEVEVHGQASDGALDLKKHVTVTVRSPPTLLVKSVSPDHLLPGQDTAANVTLANLGTAPVSNVVGTWASADGALLPLGGSNEFQVASLAAGAEVVVPLRFTSDADTAPGPHAITFTLTYNDPTGTEYASERSVGVVFGGRAALLVSVQDVEEDAVTVAVSNVGLNPVTGVQVRLRPEQGFKLTNADAIALGNLAVGAHATATFDVEPTGASPLARVEVTYTDAFGERRNQTSVLAVDELRDGLSLDTAGVVAVTVAAVLVLEAIVVVPRVVKHRRRAREEREREEEALFDLDDVDDVDDADAGAGADEGPHGP